MKMQLKIRTVKACLAGSGLPLVMLLFMQGNVCNAQGGKSLTLQECYTLASQNYPLIKQADLISRSAEYNVSNASKAYLPQVSISGQATYQSDVIQFPLKVPGMSIDPLSKDQYKIVADINQTVYDGGVTRQQKEIIRANAEVEKQKLETDLYNIRSRINQLYFGILLLDEQITQTNLVLKELNINLRKTVALIENGMALQMNADIINAETLKLRQRVIEIISARKAYVVMLSYFINRELKGDEQFVRPEVPLLNQPIARKELSLFEAQQRVFEMQDKLSDNKLMPKASVFAQTGYGKPGLNMLKNEFDFFYIAGIRLNWNLSSLYTFKNEKMINSIGRDMIGVQKETFMFNTGLSLKQQDGEMDKLQQLLDSDKEIIKLRTEIKNTAQVQLDRGVITANDYLRELNAEDQAKQNSMLHAMQLLMAQYNYSITNGN